jgi:multiple sugar transport system substrate-binding protein
MKSNLSRRDFLRMTAAAGAGLTLGTIPTALAADIRAKYPSLQSDTPVVLRVVSGQDATEIEVREQIAEMFQTVNENVEVEIVLITGARDESQTVMIAGGNPPDVLYFNEWFQYPFMQKGVTMPLDSFIERDGYSFDDIVPEAVELCRYKGQMMAMPFEVTPLTIVYNKSLFDEAGIPYPPTSWDDPEWTWDKLIEVAKQLTNPDTGTYGFSIENWMYPSILYQYGGNVLSNSKEIQPDTRCVINSPEAAQAFQLMVDLRDVHGVSPSAASSQELGGFDRFMSGRVAMYCYGRWLNVFRTITDFEWDTAPLPHVEGREPATQMFTLNYSLYANTPNAEVGWEFLKFLLTPEPQAANVATGMAVAAYEPINETPEFLNAAPPEHNSVYSEGLAYARPSENLDVPFNNELTAALDRIFTGAVPVEQGLNDAADAVNAVLDTWRLENGMA